MRADDHRKPNVTKRTGIEIDTSRFSGIVKAYAMNFSWLNFRATRLSVSGAL